MTTPYVDIVDSRIDANSPVPQDLTFDVRNDLRHLKERLDELGVASDNSIYDDFACSSIDTSAWVSAVSAGAPLVFEMGVDGRHAVTFQCQSNEWAIMRGIAGRLRFRLNKDLAVICEIKVDQSVSTAETTNLIFGFQDAGLGDVQATIADYSDMIGFRLGPTAGQYRFRQAKGGAATEQNDIGVRAGYHILRLEITRTGGVSSVVAKYDGTAIPNSPFTTNIPDTVVLMPFMGVEQGAVNDSFYDVDYNLSYFSQRPLL